MQVCVDIFQERGHHADVKNQLSVEQLHGIVGNYDGMVIRSATKVWLLGRILNCCIPVDRQKSQHRSKQCQSVVLCSPQLHCMREDVKRSTKNRMLAHARGQALFVFIAFAPCCDNEVRTFFLSPRMS